jgi:hypothetical protein
VRRKASRFRFRPAAARFYPCRLELSREARSPVHSLEAGSVLSLPFPLRESRSFSSQFNPVNASSVLPVPSSENRLAKFYFPIQLRLRQLSFIFAAIPELTREVFLPDQSAAHTKRSEKCWQELSRENSVEICACLWKKVFIHFFSKGWMVAFTRN